MKRLEINGISKDFRYLFTNKGVTKLSHEKNDLNGKNIASYTLENLNVALTIMQENLNFYYKNNKISLIEYTTEPRKFLNFLLEILSPKNSIKILQEWENKIGNKLLLINESVDKLIIESRVNESWESIRILAEEGEWWNPVTWGKNLYKQGEKAVNWTKDQVKQIKDKGFGSWAKEKAGKVWSYVKDKVASAWNCVKSGVECIMEGMRNLVFSAAGTAILTGVSMIPVVGQVTNGIIFGALLIWDIYKGLSGKGWDVVNIIIDCVSLLLPALGKVVKTSLVGIKSFARLGVEAVKRGGILAKVFNAIKNGLQSLQSFISKAAIWLGDKLGLTSLKSWGTKVQEKMAGLVDDMKAGAKTGKADTKKIPTFKQEVKKIWNTPKTKQIPTTGQVVKTMGKTFVITSALCAALGLEPTRCKPAIENGEVTQEELQAAIEKSGQEVQQQISQELSQSGALDDVEFEL